MRTCVASFAERSASEAYWRCNRTLAYIEKALSRSSRSCSPLVIPFRRALSSIAESISGSKKPIFRHDVGGAFQRSRHQHGQSLSLVPPAPLLKTCSPQISFWAWHLSSKIKPCRKHPSFVRNRGITCAPCCLVRSTTSKQTRLIALAQMQATP